MAGSRVKNAGWGTQEILPGFGALLGGRRKRRGQAPPPVAAGKPNQRRLPLEARPDPTFVSGRRVLWIKVRIGFLLLLLAIGLGLIVRRAFVLQLQQGDELRQMAEQQYLREVRLPGRRGIPQPLAQIRQVGRKERLARIELGAGAGALLAACHAVTP